MLTKRLSASALLACLLAAGADAQSVFVPDNDSTSGTCNVIPFGSISPNDTTWSNQKYQTLVTASQLGFSSTGGGTICDLAFAPCSSGTRVFKTIEIKLDHVKGASLSQTFSSNITASAVTVLNATDYEWHNTANKWNRIGLQKNFVYLAALGNLCIEITVTGAGLVNGSSSLAGFHRSNNVLERRYAINWTAASGPPSLANNSNTSLAGQKVEVLFGANDLATFGTGCPGSNNMVPTLSLSGSAKIGSTVGIDLANASANARFFLNIATTTLQPPTAMSIFGGGTCRLFSPVTLVLGGSATSAGTNSLQVNIPNDNNLVCQRAYVQYFPFDIRANPLGLTASNYGRILVGN